MDSNAILDSEESTKPSSKKKPRNSKSTQILAGESKSITSSSESQPSLTLSPKQNDFSNADTSCIDTVPPKSDYSNNHMSESGIVDSKSTTSDTTIKSLSESEKLSCQDSLDCSTLSDEHSNSVSMEPSDIQSDSPNLSQFVSSEKPTETYLVKLSSDESSKISDKNSEDLSLDKELGFLQVEGSSTQNSRHIDPVLKKKCIKGLRYEANFNFCNKDGVQTSFQNFLVSWLIQTEDEFCLSLSKHAKMYEFMTVESRMKFLNLIANRVLGFSCLDDLIAQEDAMAGLESFKPNPSHETLQTFNQTSSRRYNSQPKNIENIWTDSWNSNLMSNRKLIVTSKYNKSLHLPDQDQIMGINHVSGTSKEHGLHVKSKIWFKKSEESDFFISGGGLKKTEKSSYLNQSVQKKYEDFLLLEKMLTEEEKKDWNRLIPFAKEGIEFKLSKKIDIWNKGKKKAKNFVFSSSLTENNSFSTLLPPLDQPFSSDSLSISFSSISTSLSSSSSSISPSASKRIKATDFSTFPSLSSTSSTEELNSSFTSSTSFNSDATFSTPNSPIPIRREPLSYFSVVKRNSFEFSSADSIHVDSQNSKKNGFCVNNEENNFKLLRVNQVHTPSNVSKNDSEIKDLNDVVFSPIRETPEVSKPFSNEPTDLSVLKKNRLRKRKSTSYNLEVNYANASTLVNEFEILRNSNDDNDLLLEADSVELVRQDVNVNVMDNLSTSFSSSTFDDTMEMNTTVEDEINYPEFDKAHVSQSKFLSEAVDKNTKTDERNPICELDDPVKNEKADESEKKVKRRKKKNENLSEFLDKKISDLKFLTPTQREKLNMENFFTVRQLIQHFPRTFIDYSNSFDEINDGSFLAVIGTVSDVKTTISSYNLSCLSLKIKCERSSKTKSSPLEVQYDLTKEKMGDDDDYLLEVYEIHWKKFMRGKFGPVSICRYLETLFSVGDLVLATGKVKQIGKNKFDLGSVGEIKNLKKIKQESEIDIAENEIFDFNRPIPIYPAKGVLKPSDFQNIFFRLLPKLPTDIDAVPDNIKNQFQLMDLRDAFVGIHKPQNNQTAEVSRQRLVFDEFFYHQLGILFVRNEMRMNYIARVVEIYSKRNNDNILDDRNDGNGSNANKNENLDIDCNDATTDVHGSKKISSDYLVQMINDASKREYPIDKWNPLAVSLLKALPFQLTASQYYVLSEIMADLSIPIPMNRLLQGDVGCGKTIVALLALTAIVGSGYQAAIMAPTEFLAQQHASKILQFYEYLPENERPKICLLTGSTKRAKSVRLGLSNGDIQVAIGTHALISDGTSFHRLGLAVIDEQHKFGVAQRSRILEKGIGMDSDDEDVFQSSSKNGPVCLSVPHVLAMSATPIPRTLALAMYGNMSISKISELPPGRSPIKTLVLSEESREDAYDILRQELNNGGKAFVVFPLIDKSDTMDLRSAEEEYDKLTENGGYLHGYACGLVHGRLPVVEKNEVMKEFKNGKLQVVVSTTVIEVGIDIPEASVMLVEHAERYGLAQLHQLRGRVGRGERKSICIFIASTINAQTKLKALEKISDGFILAELDLQRRGPGELLGKKQSGNLPEFTLARLEEDGDTLEKARLAAEILVSESQILEDYPRLRSELVMRRNSTPFSQ